MIANINEDELRLLAYLHESVTGFGPVCALYPEGMAETLGLADADLLRHASFLEQHKLIGFEAADRTHVGSKNPDFMLMKLWLTGLGEDYMRTLESAPGISKKITAAVAKESWIMIRDTATQTLAQIMATIYTGTAK